MERFEQSLQPESEDREAGQEENPFTELSSEELYRRMTEAQAYAAEQKNAYGRANPDASYYALSEAYDRAGAEQQLAELLQEDERRTTALVDEWEKDTPIGQYPAAGEMSRVAARRYADFKEDRASLARLAERHRALEVARAIDARVARWRKQRNER
ncbi:MAG: hypothetical protein PHR51_01040 [Patescibacteria group bacterium]|nr:hypothetical protein [Patescibacteria group bacterium]